MNAHSFIKHSHLKFNQNKCDKCIGDKSLKHVFLLKKFKTQVSNQFNVNKLSLQYRFYQKYSISSINNSNKVNTFFNVQKNIFLSSKSILYNKYFNQNFQRNYSKLNDIDLDLDANISKPSDVNKQEYLKYITIKTISDIPPKYHKKINDHIPNLMTYKLVEKREMKEITLSDAKKLASELKLDLVLVSETEEGEGLLKIYDYNKEMEKVLLRLQDNEIDAIIRKKINENKGKHHDVLETLNLRIDKSGAEMKANLAKKLFIKGKFVMFDIYASNQEDIDLAIQKLKYVKDFIEREFPDIAKVSQDIESFKKRVFVEFSPSEALLRERKEAEQARRNAALEKERNLKKAKLAQAQKPSKSSSKKNENASYKGKRFEVQDF